METPRTRQNGAMHTRVSLSFASPSSIKLTTVKRAKQRDEAPTFGRSARR
jgi:hypothetical protein